MMEDILRKLVGFPTVSGDRIAMHELLRYVADFVSARGMDVTWFDSNGFESVVAVPAGRAGLKAPAVMLGAHADVVPAEPGQFTLSVDEGKYLGRGVYDMKFAIAAYLHIIDDIKDSINAYDIGLMVTSDEELGGENGVGEIVNNGYLPKVCLLPDGGENWQIQTGSKGILLYEIVVEGKSAHGSRPWLGDNAITKALGLLDEISLLFPKIPTPGSNTISLTKIQSGEAINQIPNAAKMTIDVRAVDSHEYKKLDRNIREICKRNNASCTCVSEGAPTSFNLEDPMLAPFAKHIAAVTGTRVEGFFAMGSSDARYFVPYGVPVISVYPPGGNIHGDGEWIGVTALGQFKEITRRYLDEVALTKS